MSSCTTLNETMGWKLYSYLETNPNHYDVAFSVGPKKTIVKALSIILRALSPVFEREFKDSWGQAVMKEGEGILLPEFDPVAFKLFLKLLILDTWSVDALKALKLLPSQLLHLMTVCRKYEMTVAVKSLTELLEEFFRSFPTYVETDDFLLLSEQQLESILVSDEIPMSELDICQNACKWADEQCKKQNMEMTSLNRRQVLGNCLYQIRFSIMSMAEFTKVTRINKGLLSMEETIEIFQFIGMEEDERMVYDTKELKFKSEKRKHNTQEKTRYTSIPDGCSVLSVVKLFPEIGTPFVCDGSMKYHYFNTDIKIAVRGYGFLGPIDADSLYDVTVEHWKRSNNNGYENETEFENKLEKRIFAKKSETFYFILDRPVVLEPIPFNNWRDAYKFCFALKGPNTRSIQQNGNTNKIYDGSREFSICWCYSQLVEILYITC